MPNSLAARLSAGQKALGLDLSAQQQTQLLDYLALLLKWNSAFNLSAIRDPIEALDKHILDSLSLYRFIESGKRYLDIGAGAGLPGIPLAIICPDIAITLIDSNGKKTRFIHQAITELGLTNAVVLQTRVEQLPDNIEFDVVLARALATISQMLSWLGHRFSAGKKLLAMKGVFPEQELSEIDKAYTVGAVQELYVPGIAGKRHLVEVLASSTNTHLNSGEACG